MSTEVKTGGNWWKWLLGAAIVVAIGWAGYYLYTTTEEKEEKEESATTK